MKMNRRIAIGNWKEATHPNALKGALAEFISVFIFVFVGEGSGMAFNKLTTTTTNSSNSNTTTPTGLIASAIAHAFALSVANSLCGRFSGGHVNPAATFGNFVGGNITLCRGIIYWIAQLLASVVACLLLNFTSGGQETRALSLSPGVSVWNALVLEIVMTFGLLYTVFATAVDPNKGNVGKIAPLVIGFIVGANILVGGAFDGGCMNPAAAFGPALVSWTWERHHWVYWVGPLIGGGLAGFVYDSIFINHSYEKISNDY